jgi:hypothetical protein
MDGYKRSGLKNEQNFFADGTSLKGSANRGSSTAETLLAFRSLAISSPP